MAIIQAPPALPAISTHDASPEQKVEVALRVRDLTVTYGDVQALEDVSFEIAAGDQVAIIGPNGAGKSTLMKAMLGLLPVLNGEIEIAGSTNRLGYVPQHEEVDWNFPVTVRDVVLMGVAREVGWLRLPRKQHRERADEALARVGISDLANRQVGELSGGQRRRVFIARALAQQADVLLLDEPFSGVDVRAQAELMDVLDRLNAQGITILLSTHDLELAFHRFNHVMALRRRLIAYGAPETVYRTDVLDALYERPLLAWQNGQPVRLIHDEHGCDGC